MEPCNDRPTLLTQVRTCSVRRVLVMVTPLGAQPYLGTPLQLTVLVSMLAKQKTMLTPTRRPVSLIVDAGPARCS